MSLARVFCVQWTAAPGLPLHNGSWRQASTFVTRHVHCVTSRRRLQLFRAVRQQRHSGGSGGGIPPDLDTASALANGSLEDGHGGGGGGPPSPTGASGEHARHRAGPKGGRTQAFPGFEVQHKAELISAVFW